MIALLLALQMSFYGGGTYPPLDGTYIDNGSFGGLPAYIVVTPPANCRPYTADQIVTSTSLPWDNPQYLHRFCFGPGSAADPTPLGRP